MTAFPVVMRPGVRFERATRFGIAGVGLIFFAWALCDPRLRLPEGFPAGAICLPLAVGLGLLIVGLAAWTAWWRAAMWLALALIGQAAALQLIDAGNQIHWQHYRPLAQIIAGPWLPLLLLVGIQTSLVALGIAFHARILGAWLRQDLTYGRLVMIVLALVAMSAAAQRDLRSFAEGVVLGTLVQVVSLGNIVLLARALPADQLLRLFQRLRAFAARVGLDTPDRPRRVDRLVLALAVWVFVAAATLNLVSYERHPHITDEVAYLLQARLLAAGTFAVPAPPVPEAFELYLVEVKDGQWFAVTPPGWPAALAVGVRLGVPWLVNPLLAAVNLLLTAVILSHLYGRRTALLAVLLLAVSPWYVFMGMNFMTHMLTLTCLLLAAVGVIKARQRHALMWAGLAGAAVGVATLIRPLDGVIVGALIGLWAIGVGGRRLPFPAIGAFVAMAALAAALVVPFNLALSGSATAFPINTYLDAHFGPGRNDLGFGENRGYGWPIQPFPGHSPLGGLINAELNTFSMNIELFGWGMGSLLLAVFFVLRGRLRRADYLMLAVCAAVFVPYFFYYFSGGPDFGARYWFLMIVPLVALTVRGIALLWERLARERENRAAIGARVFGAVAALGLIALATYFPWRAIDKYHHYWGMRPDLHQLAQMYAFGRSLVLIQASESHPDYASAAVYNPLDWNTDMPIYAWDRDPDTRARLLAAFADRPVWLVQAPSVTRRGYEVIAGPLPARSLMVGQARMP